MELRSTLWVVFACVLGAGCGNGTSGGNGNGDGGAFGDGGLNTAACADPAVACGAECVDLNDDADNCGACGMKCMGGHVEHALCLSGTCSYDTCTNGWSDCDGDVSNGCEQPTSSDVDNCGGCGIVCQPSNSGATTCVDGVCSYTQCSAGYADCDGDASNGCETSLGDDNANCGACGNQCGGGTVCAGGVCGLVCTGALTLCGSGANVYCTLTDDDPDNCGACGHSCAPDHVDNKACAGGQCTYHQCDTNYGDCDGDPSNGCETCLTCTIDNCGGCGIKCLAVHTQQLQCSDQGTCDWTTCMAGWGDCDNSTDNGCETNIDSDPAHCGPGCTPCTAGQTCVSGVCTP